ncbi:MAG: PKD domain-containing protein [Flavobacteriales bacterium]|nr:PKD domain-containing protein [Flavobacteriales bacterium]
MKKLILSSTLLLLSQFLFSHGKSNTEADYHFNENKGQFDSKVKYHSQIHVGDIFFENNTFTFDLFSSEDLSNLHKVRHTKKGRELYGNQPFNLRKSVYKMNFLNANPNVVINSDEERDGVKNYLKGNDPSKWAVGVKSYYHLTYDNLYNGIDVQIYSKDDFLKYDFIVDVGANPNDIIINYEGVEKIEITNNGNLNIILPNTSLNELAPVAYQMNNGKKKVVPCKFVLNGNNLSFEFPNGYDIQKELIIDPTWIFSTFTGSSADNWGFTATYDDNGNFYGGGIAFSSGFPVSTGAYDVTFGSVIDAAIIKYDPTGANRIYATYLGGNRADQPHSLVTTPSGELIVMGATASTNFPTSVGAYNTSHNGGTTVSPNSATFTGGSDIFITKFNAAGNGIVGSTYLGGSGNDGLALNATLNYNYSDENRGEVVIDNAGSIYIVSTSNSNNYPTTPGSHQTSLSGNYDAVVSKLSPNLDALTWSTYLGGTSGEAGYSIRVNETNNTVAVCGGTLSNNIGTTAGVIKPTYGGSTDGFLGTLNDNNGSLNALTYIGTNNYDQAYILEIDKFGNVYTTGQTKGNYPVVNAPYSVAGSAQFIHKMSSDLTTTDYSTVFGDGANSSVDISITAFLVDNCSNVYVAGWGGSTNNEGSTSGLPVTGNAIDGSTDGSDFYFFVLERDAQSLLYGTFFGGSGAEHVDGGTSRFDKRGTIYQGVCAGCGGSNSFPTTAGSWSTTNGSSNCNFGSIKIGLDFQGIVANADDPGDVLLCGAPFNVDFSAGATPPPNTYWDFGDGNTLGIGSDYVFTHTYADTGSYNVMYVAIDSSSCNIADTVYFDVTVINNGTLDAQIDIPPYNPCQDSLTVQLAFTGSGADSLYWNMGNGDSFINDTLINYTYTTNGDYVITFEAYDFACGGFNTIRDTIHFNPVFTAVQATSPGDQEYCGAPFNVDFTAGSTPPPNNYWDFGDGSGTSTLPSITYTYADTGSYTVMYVAIDSNTCNIADTAYFDINLVPAEVLDAQFTIPPYNDCQDSLTINLQFTGTGADSLYWSMGDGTTYINDTLVNHTYTSNGDFIVVFEAYDLQCNNTETFTDTIHFNPNYTTVQATPPGDQILCAQPYNVDFTSGATPPPNNFWDFGDGSGTSTLPSLTYTYADTGSYTVMYVAIDSSTCNTADTAYFDIQLIKPEALDAQFNIPPYDPCQSSLTINLQFTGTGADSLYWDMGDGTTFIDDLVINHTYTTPGEFIVVFEAYDLQCNNTEIFTDTVHFNPNNTQVNTNIDPSVDICGADLVVDFSSGNPAPPQNFWDFGDGTTSTQIDPSHSFPSAGTYNGLFVAIDSTTCNIADSLPFTIVINQIPEVELNIGYVPPVPCEALTYEVNISASSTGADSIYWNMGDGMEFFNDTLVNYEYLGPGSYPIVIELYKDGCAPKVFNSEATFIELGETTGIIPNVFTPNGDNWNDELEFVGVDKTEDYSVKIFDRWGRKVFESTSATDNWDGGGHAAGTYFYELRYTDVCSNEEKLVTGYVTLLRGPKK